MRLNHPEPVHKYPAHLVSSVKMWFDSTEPSLTTSLHGKQGVHGDYALVWGGSRTANLLEPSRTAEIARFVEFFHMSSGWFASTEPSDTFQRCTDT